MLNHPPRFRLAAQRAGWVELAAPEGFRVHIFVLEDDIIRVLVASDDGLTMPRTWAVAPGLSDVPYQGRDRFDLSGFSLPPFTLDESADALVIATSRLRVTVRLAGFFCTWETWQAAGWQPLAQDRPTQAYNWGWWDEKVYHYLVRSKDELYFGLGERSGDANRLGRSFRMCNLDPMGYNARTTDPLYKHIPYYLTWKPAEGRGFGLFYDTLSDCTFNLGQELDNYHGPYRSFIADFGELDYYVIAGTDPAAITRRYTWLTGRPALMPRWGLGYSGSTMTYTDAPNAQERMNEFIDGCRKNDILVDSFHLSSGYTSIGNKRYVFHWNREKFPDPAGFVRHFLDHGIRLCANIKPCLLRDHPRFAEAERQGLFIKNPNGSPAAVQFWDETGAYLDFTNQRTFQWWKDRVKEALLDYGVAATWNDNNEFEIWGAKSLADGFGRLFPARQAKPLQTLLMLKASREAQIEHNPAERPFLVSRSGMAGMQRYVQTWSGDNYTSWETLRYNIRMGTGLAISGISNAGHDIGGFSGPAPGPELLLRWVQFGIFLPRFSIHSWNDDGTVNEPWMYPEVTGHIRDLIRLRYRLLPYIYDALWQYHQDYLPVIRPTWHDFPDDPLCFAENDEMLLGDALLVAPVVESGAVTRSVYLPKACVWRDFWTGERFAGGQTIVRPAPAERPVLLVREGAIIPVNEAELHFGRARADQRGFLVFAGEAGSALRAVCHEDDGISSVDTAATSGVWEIEGRAEADHVVLNIAWRGYAQSEAVTQDPLPPISLAPGDHRRLVLNPR